MLDDRTDGMAAHGMEGGRSEASKRSERTECSDQCEDSIHTCNAEGTTAIFPSRRFDYQEGAHKAMCYGTQAIDVRDCFSVGGYLVVSFFRNCSYH